MMEYWIPRNKLQNFMLFVLSLAFCFVLFSLFSPTKASAQTTTTHPSKAGWDAICRTRTPSWGAYGFTFFDPSTITMTPNGNTTVKMYNYLCNASGNTLTGNSVYYGDNVVVETGISPAVDFSSSGLTRIVASDGKVYYRLTMIDLFDGSDTLASGWSKLVSWDVEFNSATFNNTAGNYTVNINGYGVVCDTSCVKTNEVTTPFRIRILYDVCSNIAGDQFSVPVGYQKNGNNCLLPKPTCTISNQTVAIGTTKTYSVVINNKASIQLDVTGVSYSGFGDSGNPPPIDISGFSGRNYTTGQVGPVNNNGPIAWTITYNTLYATGAETVNLGNCINVSVSTLNPVCSAPDPSIVFGEDLTLRLVVYNPNAVGMTVNTVSYSINTSPVTNGSGSLTVPPPPATGPPNTISAGGNVTYADTIAPNAIPSGTYRVTWTISTQFGNCASDSEFTADITISLRPYARFYGADIFAGGGVGEACTSTVPGNASGFVLKSGSGDGEYKGTGAQLAVFALGLIDEVQPLVERTGESPRSLAFANTVGTNPVFGGGFADVACTRDYYADAVNVSSVAGSTDLSTLASGAYTIGATDTSRTTLSTGGSGIASGRDITIYVKGDVVISGSNFGFANTAWADVDSIPSLYVITNGNVYIDSAVSNIDAVIIAQQPNKAIFTCAGSSANLNLVDNITSGSADSNFLASGCKTKLTVNGAFISTTVHLLRTLGNITDGSAGEGPSANQAETFIFSPDMYLNSNPSISPINTNQTIDSILSLPPIF